MNVGNTLHCRESSTWKDGQSIPALNDDDMYLMERDSIRFTKNRSAIKAVTVWCSFIARTRLIEMVVETGAWEKSTSDESKAMGSASSPPIQSRPS